MIPVHISTGEVYYLPRNFILTKLQGSSLAASLGPENKRESAPVPEAKDITLTDPRVTPEVMQMLFLYSQGYEPASHIPSLAGAAEALNTPWLNYYVDPLYDEIPNVESINDDTNRHILQRAMGQDKAWMIRYFLSKGWVPSSQDFIWAVELGALEIVKVLLESGQVNPADYHNEAISAAACQKNPAMIQILLADPRVNPGDYDNQALFSALLRENLEVVKLLLADPRVNPAARQNMAIISVASGNRLEEAKLLLADPRVNPADQDNLALNWAKMMHYPEMVELLSADPRVRN